MLPTERKGAVAKTAYKLIVSMDPLMLTWILLDLPKRHLAVGEYSGVQGGAEVAFGHRKV